MIGVYQEGDRAILDLDGRRKDVRLSPGVALTLAGLLEEMLGTLNQAPPSLFKGLPWDIRVESKYGLVCLHIEGPDVGAPERVPLRAGPAKALADRLRTAAEWAQYHLSLIVKNVG